MELEYKGANCIVLKTKQATLVVDPNIAAQGLKNQDGKAVVQLATQPAMGVTPSDALLLDGPGEYEVSNISVRGVPVRLQTDTPEEGNRGTMYRIDTGEVALAVLGHCSTPLSEDQLEQLGVVDIVVVPVGGNGYTLDAHSAVQVVRQLDPKLVIPTHYADSEVAYEVPQMDLEPFVKELAATPEETQKLKIKGQITNETLGLVILQRTA